MSLARNRYTLPGDMLYHLRTSFAV